MFVTRQLAKLSCDFHLWCGEKKKLQVVRKKVSAPVQNDKQLSFIKRGYHEIFFCFSERTC
jgi:hypothetical protein